MTRINGWACFLLVSLRLVIGWHFLVEGVHKIESHRAGKTPTNTPWTGEGFFKEANGPAADAYRQWLEVGDQDRLARLRSSGPLPKPLADDWAEAFRRFSEHYALTPEQKQVAEEKLKQTVTDTAAWLSGATRTTVKKSMAWGPVELQLAVPERLTEYDAKVREIESTLNEKLPAFNKDVEKARLRTLKADAARVLADLSADLDARTAALKSAWTNLLTDAQKTKGPPPDAKATRRIVWLDRLTMWSQAILGGCLLVGLFTRLSSLLLAGFLVQIVLLAPALPFAPAAPGSVGHYLYINLYTIELVALLVLVAIPTGRWFGVDALLSARRPILGRQAARPAVRAR